MRGTRVAAAVLAGALTGSLAACSSDDEDGPVDQAAPAAPAAVEIAAGVTAGEPIRVGVLLTLRSRPGEGADHRLDAAGAQVAAYRASLGGTDVTLVTEDDGGTSRGARDAVARMVDEGVSGIVVASDGRHLARALGDASEAGVPTLLPYAAPAGIPEGVWSTGPSQPALEAALLAALREDGNDRPYVVTGDGVSLDGVGSADAAGYRPGRAGRIVDDVVRAAEAGDVDSVVLGASASSLADLVTRIAGQAPDLPVYLSDQALTAPFARAVVDEAGALLSGMRTVGVDAADTTTLDPGPAGRATAAFFSALRLAAGDPALRDLLGSGSFRDVAADADTASHDAVVALVRAVDEAGTTDAAAVRDALPGLTVDGAAGLAGPALDFSSPQALPDSAVVPLVATTQDPGVRPTGEESPRLFWFAAGGAQD